MTSPGPTRQPAAAHAERATPQHAGCHLLTGRRGSPGKWRPYGAGWPGAWAPVRVALSERGSCPRNGRLLVITRCTRARCRPSSAPRET
jgi:hypothetical protein